MPFAVRRTGPVVGIQASSIENILLGKAANYHVSIITTVSTKDVFTMF
jgi:hypothetical protein